MKLLFLQQRPVRAGAQTSLARLLEALRPSGVEARVLCSTAGWLAEHCSQHGIGCDVLSAPKPRSLRARIYANRGYVGSVLETLRARAFQPDWVVANDTEESIHAHALAQSLRRPWAVILRKPGLSRREFLKYGADGADAVFAVGDELLREAQIWMSATQIHAYREGLLETEFHAPKPKPAAFPLRILVAGSEQPRKGWQDFFAALAQIERAATDFPAVQFDFTGAPTPEWPRDHRGRCRFDFLGRVPEFTVLARRYDLALHPSRAESFGLAPVELLAAGVPTLCSTTGFTDGDLLPAILRFPPGDVAALAQRLLHLWRHWPDVDFELTRIQHELRGHCSMQSSARHFLDVLSGTRFEASKGVSGR